MLNNREYFTFDDVLIVPNKSLESRDHASTSQSLCDNLITVQHPIIPANMDTIAGTNLCWKQMESSGIAILHRYMLPEERVRAWYSRLGCGSLYISVGVSKEEQDVIKLLAEAGCYCYCIDIAHAHSTKVLDTISFIKEQTKHLSHKPRIIVGNIATPTAAAFILDAHPDIEMLKIGIGPGSLCSTRIVTGCGVPQLSAIMDIREFITSWRPYPVKLIADGGIKNSGDIVKAIVAGADFVMTGSLFAGCEETPGEIIIIDGKRYKTYRGMASKDAQVGWREASNSKLTKEIVPEGEASLVPIKGKYSEVLYQLIGGLKSGMSYVGATTLEQLRQNAEFIRVSSSTIVENRPHGLR